MQSRVVQSHPIEGWGFSLIFHGILLIAIVSALRHLPVPIDQDPFRWNVIFTESPRQIPTNRLHLATTCCVPSTGSTEAVVAAIP
jgi:hypothetical protein